MIITATLLIPTLIILPILIILIMCRTTIPLIRGRKFWTGYPHLSPESDIKTLEITGLAMPGTGSLKPRNLGAGVMEMGKRDPIMRYCFAMGAQGQARHILGS